MEQKVNFAKQTLSFEVGTGKDAKIFVKFKIKDKKNDILIYNIPLLTLMSIQIWTSRPKIPRVAIGSAQPIGLSKGIRTIVGFITANTENESLGNTLRRLLKNYKPVSASKLNINTDGIISIDQLDELEYLDQLPPCQINIYLSNPTTGYVFSKAIYGVVFNNEAHSVGIGAGMGAQYSFMASRIDPIIKEDISELIEEE